MGVIDRPIRPLVIEFNRIGLKTIFSCCGFNYDGEEEPKTHTRWAYIYFEEPDSPIGIDNFLALLYYAESMGWKWFKVYFDQTIGKNVYTVQSYLLPGHDTMYVKNDQIPTAIHDYEVHVLRIQYMTNFTKLLPTDLFMNPNGLVTIIDGNENKVKHFPEWQIKPKLASVVDFKVVKLAEVEGLDVTDLDGELVEIK